MLESVLFGLILSGVLKIYTDDINKKRHVLDKEKIRVLCKVNINKTPCINVKEKYIKKIDGFLNTIKNVKGVDLEIFNRNIKELVIEEKKLDANLGGTYNGSSIKIVLNDEDLDNAIEHELLHLSSSFVSGKTYYSGFKQSNYLERFMIGKGLTEGYTSLLESRIFKNESAYVVEEVFAKSIEKIIGQEKMTNLYFKADLYSLIKELTKYCLESNVYLLINNIDYINKIINSVEKPLEQEINYVINKSYETVRILCDTYINKLKEELVNDLITKEDFTNRVENFLNNFTHVYKTKNVQINFLTHDMLEEMKKEYFSFESKKNKYI